MSSALPSLETCTDNLSQALDILAAEHQPAGLINPGDGSTLTRLSDARLSLAQHNEVTMFYRDTPMPPYDIIASPVDYKASRNLAEIEERMGKTGPFALSSLVLKLNVQQVCAEQGWGNEEGNILYQVDGRQKTMDLGLMSGFVSMAALQRLVAQRVESTDDFDAVVTRSVASLPMLFAKMSRRSAWMIEHLYGSRKTNSYDAEGAAYELGIKDQAEHQIVIDEAIGKAIPSHWDEAAEFLYGNGECPVTRLRIFGQVWSHLKNAALALPETRAEILAPAIKPAPQPTAELSLQS